MNTPTPDTMTAIERELAAAREEIALLKTNLKIQTNHTENAVQDRADEHIELHNQIQELTEQRDGLLEQQGQWRLSSVCRELVEQRDDFKTELDIANLRLKGKRHPDDNGIMADGEIDVKALTEQRDRLAEALEQLMAYQPRSTVITTNERHVWSNAKDALQSLTTNAELTHPESKP